MDDAKRRTLAVGLGAILSATASAGKAATPNRYKAVVFDGFPIFDVRPIGVRTESYFPEKGAALTLLWRTRQFEYQWLSSLMNRYVDFTKATEQSLDFASNAMGLSLTAEMRDSLVGMYQSLGVWPDVPGALNTLRDRGLRLGMLSNMTQNMLDRGLSASGVSSSFEHVLSTDTIRSYKPSPVSYQLAVDQFHLQPAEILFVPFAGWDAAGAKSFGYPTYWINRIGAPAEFLGYAPDGAGKQMSDLLAYLG